MIAQNRTVHAFNLIWLWDRLDSMGAMLDDLIALQLGAPHISKIFSFLPEPTTSTTPASSSAATAAAASSPVSTTTATATAGGAPEALRYFQSGASVGKIVLDLSSLHNPKPVASTATAAAIESPVANTTPISVPATAEGESSTSSSATSESFAPFDPTNAVDSGAAAAAEGEEGQSNASTTTASGVDTEEEGTADAEDL
jgi:hypothetical protein